MTDKSGQASAAGHSRGAWPLLPFVLFLILAGVSLLLHLEKSRRYKELQNARTQSSSTVRSQTVEMAKAQRGLYYQIQLYLGYPSATSYAVAGFIQRLGAVIPLHQVQDLQIDPGLQSFSFRLTVGIAARRPKNAQLAAAGYLKKIGKFPEIMRIELARVDRVPGIAGENRLRLYSITGQMDMQ